MYSRRDFGKLALAGLPAAALSTSEAFAAKVIDSKVHGVWLGSQSYSFRDRPLDDAIKAMADCGVGVCELFAGHVENPGKAPVPARRGPGGPGGGPGGAPKQDPEARKAAMAAARENLRKWRLSVSLDEFKAVRKKFDDAGIDLYAYNYSFRDDFTDDEIERGFEFAKALGVKYITASSTVSAVKRVVPFAEKHKTIVAMHGHSSQDPNEFAKPESFDAAMAMTKYFKVNLDIGHFTAAGYDPVDYISKHHADIIIIHLKDRKKDNGQNTPWGEGDTNIKGVLQLLRDKKYAIPALVEYEYMGKDDAIVEVKKCLDYARQALA